MSAPEISVIIATARQTERLTRCLDSIAACAGSVVTEVVVVLNAAVPGVAAVARAHPVVGVVAESATSLGFAGACNLGRSQATAPAIMVLHDDAILLDGCLEALARVLRERPDIGVCGTVTMAPDGSIRTAGRVVFSDACTEIVADPAPAGRPADYCDSSCIAVRAQAWDDIGGLEEAMFPAGYVDVDLAFSARSRGWQTWLEPSARAIHDSVAGTMGAVGYKAFVHARNRALFAEKWADALREEFEPRDPDDLAGSLERALRRSATRTPVRREPRPLVGAAVTEVDLLRAYVSSTDAELARVHEAAAAQHAAREEADARLAATDREARDLARENESLRRELEQRRAARP